MVRLNTSAWAGCRTSATPGHAQLLQLLQHLYSLQYLLLAGFLYLPGQNVFIQNGVHTVEVEHNVQLANIGKVRIQKLDEEMDGFQVAQLVVGNVDGNGEEQAGISPVDELVGGVFDEIGVLFVPGGDQPMNLGFYPGLLGFR